MEIPCFPGKRIEINLYRLRTGKLRLMITPLFQIKELGDLYKGEWFYQKWWFVDLPF